MATVKQLKFDGEVEELIALCERLGLHGVMEYTMDPTPIEFRMENGAIMLLSRATSRVTFGGSPSPSRKLRDLFRPHLRTVAFMKKRKLGRKPTAIVLPFKRPDR